MVSSKLRRTIVGSLTFCVEGQARNGQSKPRTIVGSLTFCVEGQARNGQLKTSPYDRGVTHILRGRTSEKRSAENLVERSWDHSLTVWKDKRETVS